MRIGRIFLTIIASLLVGLVGWMYTRESLFRLSDVHVESNDSYLANEIQREWVGLLGKPLFSISLIDLEREIRSKHNVESIVIKRKWPTTLSVQIEEKTPVALRFGGGRLWLVDKECKNISQLISAKAYPILRKPKMSSPDVRAQEESLCEVIPQFQTFESSSLSWDEIDELYYDDDRGWSVRSYEKDLEIVLGHSNLFSGWQKAALAMETLVQKGFRPKFLDASYSKRVVFKLESTLLPKLQNLKDELNYKELVRRAPNKSTWASAVR